MPRDPDDDPLEALRARLEATQEAVERLAAEAAGAAGEGRGANGVPRDGGAAGAPDVPGATASADTELRALVALVETLRGVLPAALQAQLTEVIRQVLILVRSVLDWWIERMAPLPGPGGPPEVEDIEVS
jgi:hypothetical protein